MAHKQKGQLTTSGEWAKHLRGFLKRHFWKGERIAAKTFIRNDLKINSRLTYKNHEVYELNDQLVCDLQLEEIATDSTNWRSFYKNDISNWISFYPFSEYHGGGQPFIIMIGKSDFKYWINNNLDFEKSIRSQIENK